MAQMMRYEIGQRRMQKALLEGMEAAQDGKLLLTKEGVHRAFFRAIDHHGLTSCFGQLHMDWKLPRYSFCSVYALIQETKECQISGKIENLDSYFCNPKIPAQEKKDFLKQEEALVFANQKDMLLYEKRGRYLWILIEVLSYERQGGMEEDAKEFEDCKGELFEIEVINPGDNFMQTFPEIYQETGGFFHRYLSIFSSIYRQVQQKIDCLDQVLDLDMAPKELLPVYGRWLGIDCRGGFLTTEGMRKLLKQANALNRMKGSRKAVETLVKLLTGKSPIIVERIMVEKYLYCHEKKRVREYGALVVEGQKDIFNRLYGNSEVDVVVLIQENIDESMKMQMEFLLNQFKPVRCRLRIITLIPQAVLDAYCYMDDNAQIIAVSAAALDQQVYAAPQVLN